MFSSVRMTRQLHDIGLVYGWSDLSLFSFIALATLPQRETGLLFEVRYCPVHAGKQHESSWGTKSLFKYKISLCSSVLPSSPALQMIGGWNPDSNLSSVATWQALPPAPYNDHRLGIIPALPSSLHISFSLKGICHSENTI